jgi:hypothetical protein
MKSSLQFILFLECIQLRKDSLLFKSHLKPGAVAHNPSYSGGRDQADHGSRPALAKSDQDPISTNKLGMVMEACNLSYAGGLGRRT